MRESVNAAPPGGGGLDRRAAGSRRLFWKPFAFVEKAGFPVDKGSPAIALFQLFLLNLLIISSLIDL